MSFINISRDIILKNSSPGSFSNDNNCEIVKDGKVQKFIFKNSVEMKSIDGSVEENNEKNPNYIKDNKDNYFSDEELEYYKNILEKEEKKQPSYEINDDTYIKRGELIGEGGYGKVYLGFDEVEGRVIALKEISISLKESSYNSKVRLIFIKKIKSVESEINFLSHLNHKNIIRYYGVIKTQESIAIVLEYCIGGSLAKIIKTYKKLNEKILKKYLRQILNGLEYLHYHNIIHRGKL